MNCWEYKKCGRENGGESGEGEMKPCPAYPSHGKHCARVAGTLCGGMVQGTFASKLVDCMKCDFYKSEHYDKTYNNPK